MGVVVITGAASGLGWAMAQRFFARGDTLVLVDCNAALLHQRELLVLHASAIATVRGAVILIGKTATGKSSLAAAFYQRGCAVLTDEICAFSPQPGGELYVLPGFPTLYLWANELKHLGIQASSLQRARPQLEKYALPVPQGFRRDPLPIYSSYLLKPHTRPETLIEPIREAEKFPAILEMTSFPSFVEGLGTGAAHFRLVASAARQLHPRKISWLQHPFQAGAAADAILRDIDR